MKIVHVIARMNVGGTATYLTNLIQGQIDYGHEVLLLTGSVPSYETEDEALQSIPYKRIEGLSRDISPLEDILARRMIFKSIKAIKPDLIHTHTFKAGLLVRTLRTGLPLVHSFHGHHLYDPEFGYFKTKVLNFIERLLADRTDALISIGTRVARELMDARIGEADKFTCIAPGLPDFPTHHRDSVRSSLRLRNHDIALMWLGRFTQVKRPDLVLQAALMRPNIEFCMAGTGELSEEIANSAPKNLHLLGYRNREDLWSAADIGLCTSDSEGMPLALIEAQIAGVPVVSRDVGSVSEIIENGVTGFLTGDSIEEICLGIDKVIELLQSTETTRSVCKKRALELFSVESMVKKHNNVYERVLEWRKK